MDYVVVGAGGPGLPVHAAACHFAWREPPPAHIAEVELEAESA